MSCAEASGELRGENLGEEAETSPAPFLGCDLTETIDAGNGTAWTDLYRDLFSPTGAAACGNPSCHGSPEGAGQDRFACFDEAGCKASALDKLVRLPDDIAAPENSGLVNVLKRCDDDRARQGQMPLEPRNYIFSRKSIARVKAWIADGAK